MTTATRAARLQAPHHFDAETMRRELNKSELKKGVRTLSVMIDHADTTGWTCISRARIASETGTTTRTVQAHWKSARKAGYLTSYDYPMSARRTSDHWLTWPRRQAPDNPAEFVGWAKLYPADTPWPPNPPIDSGGSPPW
ncbi:hypothetical protein GCM10009611_10520 [Arthrobacter roseus]